MTNKTDFFFFYGFNFLHKILATEIEKKKEKGLFHFHLTNFPFLSQRNKMSTFYSKSSLAKTFLYLLQKKNLLQIIKINDERNFYDFCYFFYDIFL